MALLIPAMRHTDADQWLAGTWISVSGACTPRSGWSAFRRPALTEFLQMVYTLFVPAVLLVAFLLWRQRRYAEFQYYAFLIALGIPGFLCGLPGGSGARVRVFC